MHETNGKLDPSGLAFQALAWALMDEKRAERLLSLTGLTPESVQVNDMSARSFDQNDVVTLRAALSGGENAEAATLHPRLHLLSMDDLGSVPLGGYQFSRHAIEAALLGGPTELADAEASAVRPNSLLNLTQRTESTAALARGWEWLRGGFETALQWLHPRAGTRLEHWLEEQRHPDSRDHRR